MLLFAGGTALRRRPPDDRPAAGERRKGNANKATARGAARSGECRSTAPGSCERRNFMRRTYIIIRQSPDWRTQTYADLEKTRDFCRMIHRRADLIIDVVKLWDRTFSTSFFAARQAMKELSLGNLRSLAGAVIVPLAGVRDVLEPDAFYLFVDDDDWYDPGIARHMQAFDPGKCAAVLWRQVTATHELSLSDEWTFFSNNYAISGAYLLRKKKNLNKVIQHFEAEGTFHCRSLKHRIRRIGYSTFARQLLVPRAMHTIKGSGGACELQNISAFTHELETFFDKVRKGKVAVTKEIIDRNSTRLNSSHQLIS